MRVWEYNISIENFIEIYVGYKLKRINEKQILELCEKEIVASSNELRIAELRQSYIISLNCFIDKILQFCHEDNVNLYDYTGNLFNLPDEHFRIWELDSLLCLSEIDVSDEEKLDKMYELFYFFNFPRRWALNNIIRYSLKESNIMYDDNELINNLKKYIREELDYFWAKSKKA